jgi:hypothetical protein
MVEHLTLYVDVDAKRRVAVERHSARTRCKVERRKHRKCFWTHPYGHKYTAEGASSRLCLRCVGCGKEKWDGGDY